MIDREQLRIVRERHLRMAKAGHQQESALHRAIRLRRIALRDWRQHSFESMNDQMQGLVFALAGGFDSVEIANYQLATVGLRRAIHGYIPKYATFPLRDARSDPFDASFLPDKVMTHDRLETAGVRHCRPLYTLANNVVHEWPSGRRLAQGLSHVLESKQSLFFKPSLSGCARGLHTLRTCESRWTFDDEPVEGQAIEERVRTALGTEDYLVQPLLANHTDLRGLSLRSLNTLRITTWNYGEGRIRPLGSLFKMAVDNGPADNFGSSGGVACRVDLNRGICGPLRFWNPRDGVHMACHPTTGGRVEGLELPFHAEALELATEAHRCFAGVTSIGWDIAITDEGPRVLEGDAFYQLFSLQALHPEGLRGLVRRYA